MLQRHAEDTRDNPDEHYSPSLWVAHNKTVRNRKWGNLIAQCHRSDEEATADARLMAAAPQMLAALQDVISDIQGLDESDRLIWLENGTLAYVIYVINQATGKETSDAS